MCNRMVSILNELNTEQQKVVKTVNGPLLVLAGAGSGKTRSVIYRAAYLIKVKKINPWNLLIVTFTNKAARELKERLETKFRIYTNSLWIGTFHSVCTRILRKEAEFTPFNSNFSIFDQKDQKHIFKQLYKRIDVDSRQFPVNKIRNIISNQKNSLIQPKDYFDFHAENYHTKTVYRVYKNYQKYLLDNNAMDFDDLLMYAALLLHSNKTLLKKYQKQFEYIMIDEYQDTNYAQFKIVNLIAKKHKNLCVVGDDDQAIYSWRGADIKNILKFEKDYNNVKIVKLEQNYRSPKIILKLANSLIKNNKERHQKELWTAIKSSHKPELVVLENEAKEAHFVAQKIQKMTNQGSSLNDTVVLYRTNAQSRAFESAFVKKNINYQIIGGVNFFQRKEVKDIIAYLRIIANPLDNESFRRMVNVPKRGIGKRTLEKLQILANQNKQSLLQVFLNSKIENISHISKKLAAFRKTMVKWLEKSKAYSVVETISMINDDTKMIQIYENSDDPKELSRAENLKEFVASAIEFSEQYEHDFGKEPNIEEYLQNISLQTDLDNAAEDTEAVKLMTMHNAKGLEFENVFIVGLEDGLLPHSRSLDEDGRLEEERRLLYVAITRAKKTLHLSYAEYRRLYQFSEKTIPSRFLKELDNRFLNEVNFNRYNLNFTKKRKYKKTSKKRKNITLESDKFYKIGDRIIHKKFGKGKILNVAGAGENAKLTISFYNGKLKKIMGNFVKKLN